MADEFFNEKWGTMDFSWIKTEAEMDLLSGEWNHLLDESASHVPFLRHEYLMNWWKTRGGGEWGEDAQLVVITAREEGQLVGVAPFFWTPDHLGEPALMLLGSVEISDYLDLLVSLQNLDRFVVELLDILPKLDLPEWKSLDLYNLLDNSPTLDALERAAKFRGWQFNREQLQHSPYISLPGDWDAYLAGIDKKQRHEIRRKMRRAETCEDKVEWYIAHDADRITAEAEDFLRLMANDPEKEAFLTPLMREHMIRTIQCSFEADCLQLAFLTVNGEKAAAYFSFHYLNRLWVYNSGLDRRFNEVSPGWVLLGYLLQWANQNGIDEFDFMRGDEDYKYKFGAVDRFVMRATLRR